jgi:hypothetical protein
MLEREKFLTRRHFFGEASTGLGIAALSGLLGKDLQAAGNDGQPGLPHFTPTAKRVIYLFQSGAPSQMDLFDYKPRLQEFARQELPESVRMGQRLTGMTSGQSSFPVAPSVFQFRRHGASGAWISELMPHLAKVVDDVSFIKSMYTEAINHDPAVTFFQTGFQIAGRPSIGAWLSYGLGSANDELPAFVVMISQGSGNPNDQPLADRHWGSGFLPTRYQGVKFRSVGDPVLYLSDPAGFSPQARRHFIDDVARLNQLELDHFGDPEIATRIAQYEMAYKMQTSVPELTDLSKEPARTFDLYGEDARKPGTFAANCLLARRLAERGVRFIQLFHRGWDQHNDLPKQIPGQARDTDRASAALVQDLKERGLLQDTLVVWGGEFGRTVYCQGKLTPENYGRDHHPRCFTVWLSGGGVKPGISFGETDDYCYNVVKDPVHVHDLHATILHTLGIDHTRLTYRFQGRAFRLTDVGGNVVKAIL